MQHVSQIMFLFILTCIVHHFLVSCFCTLYVFSWIDISHTVFLFQQQPLSRSLNADVPEQLITPLVSLGHISMLAPDQFASPMKSIVANFIVKDLLMNDRVCGDQAVYQLHTFYSYFNIFITMSWKPLYIYYNFQQQQIY